MSVWLLLAGVATAQSLSYRVCVRDSATTWEKKAAQDLSLYLGKITGQTPLLANAPANGSYNLVVGELALELRPQLRERLAGVAKKNPVLRSDAIVLKSEPTSLYLVGSNDDSHYFAVAELLRRLGCRWYLPGSATQPGFGECIPSKPQLELPVLDFAYAPPFEVRSFMVSWLGDRSGIEEFSHRNFLNQVRVPCGHSLGKYLKKLPNPKAALSSIETALSVAGQIEEDFSKGKSVSLSIEDATAQMQAPEDLAMAGFFDDKFFAAPIVTDVYLSLYNQVCKILLQRHPDSQAKIGFLAYINLTLPPQRRIEMEKPLVCYLAPIDIDPNHPMGDDRFPDKQDYREMMRGWSKVMDGRVVIYDYDQGMLVWRDLPDPSHQVIQKDIQEYRKAGILGLDTECRNAVATTFLNIYFRSQLYWNPDMDMKAELASFYPAYFGAAAKPMEAYWTRIYQLWTDTLVREHEYFVIPAIYPRSQVAALKADFEQTKSIRLAEPQASRVAAVGLGLEILEHYTAMIEAANRDCDYELAAAHGKLGLEARSRLKTMGPMFVTDKLEKGPAFWAGEVDTYRDLQTLCDGSKGTLLEKTPLNWSFRSDPHDHGLWRNWAGSSDPKGWKSVRTDLYLQAQISNVSDPEALTGYGWYRCNLELSSDQLQDAHLMFPGIFQECWLYVNGKLVAHRVQKPMWWINDYKFHWDVDLSGQLETGTNSIVVRTVVPDHFAGMFRRPFLYRPR